MRRLNLARVGGDPREHMEASFMSEDGCPRNSAGFDMIRTRARQVGVDEMKLFGFTL